MLSEQRGLPRVRFSAGLGAMVDVEHLAVARAKRMR